MVTQTAMATGTVMEIPGEGVMECAMRVVATVCCRTVMVEHLPRHHWASRVAIAMGVAMLAVVIAMGVVIAVACCMEAMERLPPHHHSLRIAVVPAMVMAKASATASASATVSATATAMASATTPLMMAMLATPRAPRFRRRQRRPRRLPLLPPPGWRAAAARVSAWLRWLAARVAPPPLRPAAWPVCPPASTMRPAAHPGRGPELRQPAARASCRWRRWSCRACARCARDLLRPRLPPSSRSEGRRPGGRRAASPWADAARLLEGPATKIRILHSASANLG